MSHVIRIPMAPVPKGRPRATQQGRVYTPGRTRSYEQLVALCAQAALGEDTLRGPLAVSIECGLVRPQRLMRRKDPEGRVPCDRRPDADNLAKAVLDGLSGYFDDGQVCDLRVTKYYAAKGEAAATIVTIQEVTP